jgi:hypothetical protein
MGLRSVPEYIRRTKIRPSTSDPDRIDEEKQNWISTVNPKDRYTLLVDTSFLLHWILHKNQDLALDVFKATNEVCGSFYIKLANVRRIVMCPVVLVKRS